MRPSVAVPDHSFRQPKGQPLNIQTMQPPSFQLQTPDGPYTLSGHPRNLERAPNFCSRPPTVTSRPTLRPTNGYELPEAHMEPHSVAQWVGGRVGGGGRQGLGLLEESGTMPSMLQEARVTTLSPAPWPRFSPGESPKGRHGTDASACIRVFMYIHAYTCTCCSCTCMCFSIYVH